MSEEQSNFKVTDRRLFNADGTPRDLPPEEKREPEKTATASTTSTDTNSSASGNQAAQATRTATSPQEPKTSSTQTAPPDEEETDLLDAEDPASFVNFVMSIASNAASSLGMMEHPVTHKREVDLELGKHWIDVLGMLQQKTRGNLAPQEDQIVEGLLADLRMQYVSLANSSTAKGSRGFTGRDIVGGK